MQRIPTEGICLTDRHLYYFSMEKRIKISYDKILSIESYSNAIAIRKEVTNSKPVF